MPRIKKPFRERPLTLKEMDDALAAWNPVLQEYNARLRELDTPEEKALREQGRASYPERLKARRKELAALVALPLCPITAERPSGQVSGFTLQRAVEHIPDLPRIDRAVLRALVGYYRPEKKTVWPKVPTIARVAGCSRRPAQISLNRLEAAKYIAVKTGSDRKGDSRLRPDKPRAGGRAKTTHWLLNVRGIFLLAHPPKPEETDEETSPFEPEKGEEKGAPTTQNSAPTTEKGVLGAQKGVLGAPDKSSYPSIEKKRESEAEKSDTTPLSLSLQEAEQLVEKIKQLSMELTGNKSSFNRKSSKGLLAVVRKVNPTEAELKTATEELVNRMDEFELKNCGSKLEANLVACILSVRAREKETRERRERENNPDYKAQQELYMENCRWQAHTPSGCPDYSGYESGFVAAARAAFIETLSDEDRKCFSGPSPVRLPFQTLAEVAVARAWHKRNEDVNQHYQQFFEQWHAENLDGPF